MRFLCVYRPGTPERGGSPCPDEQAAMGQLISDMAKAGVLLGVEGCLPSAFGSRIRVEAGQHSITDGPFPETKELIAGFCLLQTKTKAEAVEWAKRFLSVMKEGESEIRQLHEMPAA